MRSIIAFVLLLLIASISCIFNVKKSGKESDRTTERYRRKHREDRGRYWDIEVTEGDIGTTFIEVTEGDIGTTEGDIGTTFIEVTEGDIGTT